MTVKERLILKPKSFGQKLKEQRELVYGLRRRKRYKSLLNIIHSTAERYADKRFK
jgi:hypothetical protein